MAVLKILNDEVDDHNYDKDKGKDGRIIGRVKQGRSPASSPTPPLPMISYGLSSNLLVGQHLIPIGNPFRLNQTITTGVVLALNQEVRYGGGGGGRRRGRGPPATVDDGLIRGFIQTGAAINPGNLGRPLLRKFLA